jgi:hypothetical protein
MRVISAALLSAVIMTATFAADAPSRTIMVRGTIQAIDTKSITIKTDTGTTFIGPIGLGTRFATVEKRSFSQIAPTDFIGVTAVPGENGHLKAEEIHIIPLHSLGEGQYPWDHHPSAVTAGGNMMMMSAKPQQTAMNGSMTNGTVAKSQAPTVGGSMTNGTVSANNASQLTVTFHGAQLVNGKCVGLADPNKPVCTGSSIIDVSPDTPIVALEPYRHDLVKPGVAVVAVVVTDAAGHQTVTSATVEKNGVKPEF